MVNGEELDRIKRWEDNIKESTWLDFATSTWTGQCGKGLLRNHLWCPNDLARLWDNKYLSWVYGVDRKICHEGH